MAIQTVMELMLFCIPLLILALLTILLKKFWKIMLTVIIVYLVAGLVFFLYRPVYVEKQIEKRIGHLETYLNKKYPGEGFEITRQEEINYRSVNPYIYLVSFKNEPAWQYYYLVTKEYIKQTGYVGTRGKKTEEKRKHLDFEKHLFEN